MIFAYIIYAIALILLIFSAIRDWQKTKKALLKAWKTFENILPQFLGIIVLAGILLAFLNPQLISQIIGRKSGWAGIVGAALVGSVTLILGFIAFPLAALLLQNGAGASQIGAFISSLMMVGVVTLPVEIRFLGRKVALLRNLLAFALTLLGLGALLVFRPAMGRKAWDVTLYSLKEMLLVIPPIFVLLGLLDVWVPREKMIRFMGEGSGFRGILLAYFLGAAAAGPLYAAFPIIGVFMKKGVSFRNILIFIGAWSTLKIPMFLFELSSLGVRFAVTRLLLNIPGILLMSVILFSILPASEVKALYAKAAETGG